MGRFRAILRRLKRRSPPVLGDPSEPPDAEGALVPRRPTRPLGSGAVALELPDDPEDVDARGRDDG
jgi:hypothetical protein